MRATTRPARALLAPVLLLGACASPTATQPQAPAAVVPVAAHEAPAEGWRWESYRGVELQVPAHYGYGGGGSPRNSAWCAGGDRRPTPGVSRDWHIVADIACPGVRPPSSYASAVDLYQAGGGGGEGPPPALVDLGGGWTSETIVVAGVAVTVTDDDDERRRAVLATVREVDGVDAHGCPTDSPLREPGARPASHARTPPDGVTSVAICRYVLPEFVDDVGPLAPLLSSTLLRGDGARALVTDLEAAPQGGGPDSPQSCVEEVRLGDQLVVLEIATAQGSRQVVVRYSGCDGHGTDDGTVVRALTEEVLGRVLAGPHAPASLSGDVARLYWY